MEVKLMKFVCRGVLFLLLALIILSCSSQDLSQNSERAFYEKNSKLKVLTTTAMINDLVQRVGGDYVDSMALIQGELDPHSYELVKGDDEKFAMADLIFSNGLGLEHGLSLKQNLEKNPKVFSLGDPLLKGSGLIITVEGQYDPHIWMDIALWMKTVDTIVNALSQKEPSHAAAYRENGKRLYQEMELADRTVYNLLQSLPSDRRYLITSHDAFNYFTRHYLAEPHERDSGAWKLRFAAPEGLAPDAQLSVFDIQEIIDYAACNNVCVVFPESNVSRDSLKKIIDAGGKKGLKLQMSPETLYGDAMGPPGSDGGTYIKMIEHDAAVIFKELSKGCQ